MRKVLSTATTAADMARYQRPARAAAIVSALLIGSAVAAIECSSYRMSSLGALVLGLAVAAAPSGDRTWTATSGAIGALWEPVPERG